MAKYPPITVKGSVTIMSTGETLPMESLTPIQKEYVARAIKRQMAQAYANIHGYELIFKEPLPKWKDIK